MYTFVHGSLTKASIRQPTTCGPTPILRVTERSGYGEPLLDNEIYNLYGTPEEHFSTSDMTLLTSYPIPLPVVRHLSEKKKKKKFGHHYDLVT